MSLTETEDQDEELQTLGEELDAVLVRLQHRKLAEELKEISQLLEDTILQAEIAESLFSFEVEFQDEVQETIESAAELLDAESYDELEDQLKIVRKKAQDQKSEVEQRINARTEDYREELDALRELNEEFKGADADRLDALYTLFDDWRWRQQLEGDTLQEQRKEARKFGEEMLDKYNKEKNKLLSAIFGDNAEPDLITSLATDDSFHLSDLKEDELDLIWNSKLKGYIELTLSPPDRPRDA